MANTWTWGLLAATITATALVFLAAAALGRRQRAAAPGALLIPVTALWLWSFGLTAPRQAGFLGLGMPWPRPVTTTGVSLRSWPSSTREIRSPPPSRPPVTSRHRIPTST